MSSEPWSWLHTTTISLFLTLPDLNLVIDATFSRFGPSADYLHRRQDLPANWVFVYACTGPISGEEANGLPKRTFMLYGAGLHVVRLADGTITHSEGVEAMRRPADIFASSMDYAGLSRLRRSDAVLAKLNSMYDYCYDRPEDVLDWLPVDTPRVCCSVDQIDWEAASSGAENVDYGPGDSAAGGTGRTMSRKTPASQSDAISEASSTTLRSTSPDIVEKPAKPHHSSARRKENPGSVPMHRQNAQSRHPHLVPRRSYRCGVTKPGRGLMRAMVDRWGGH